MYYLAKPQGFLWEIVDGPYATIEEALSVEKADDIVITFSIFLHEPLELVGT